MGDCPRLERWTVQMRRRFPPAGRWGAQVVRRESWPAMARQQADEPVAAELLASASPKLKGCEDRPSPVALPQGFRSASARDVARKRGFPCCGRHQSAVAERRDSLGPSEAE